MVAVAPPSPETEPPVLDQAYLDDMAGYVGRQSLAELLDSAPAALLDELAAMAAAWEKRDFPTLREAAHRLAGATGAIGAARLSRHARHCLNLAEPEFTPGLFAVLAQLAEQTLAALAGFHAQVTPVPPNPQ